MNSVLIPRTAQGKELWPPKKRDATKRPQLGYQSRYPGVKKGKNVRNLSLEGDSEVSETFRIQDYLRNMGVS